MSYLLELSLFNGIMIVVLGTACIGMVVVFIARILIQNHLNKQHERVGRLLFRVTASLIALLISLSYANEKISYNKVVNSLEEEASLIANVMIKLRLHNTVAANEIRQGLKDYVDLTIKDQWKNVVDNPYYSKMMGTVYRINVIARSLPEEDGRQAQLKSEIIQDLNLISKTMQIRFYSSHLNVPYLAYILGAGLLIAWIFFSVYELNVISLAFLTLYNSLIVLVLYFVIMLGNPMIGPLRLEPEPFIILQSKGFDKLPDLM